MIEIARWKIVSIELLITVCVYHLHNPGTIFIPDTLNQPAEVVPGVNNHITLFECWFLPLYLHSAHYTTGAVSAQKLSLGVIFNNLSNTMKTYYAYIRVSTVRQGIEGVSLQEQRASIIEYAERRSMKIVEWFEDRVTAAKRGRPVF
jgi:hypothetical protein